MFELGVIKFEMWHIANNIYKDDMKSVKINVFHYVIVELLIYVVFNQLLHKSLYFYDII